MKHTVRALLVACTGHAFCLLTTPAAHGVHTWQGDESAAWTAPGNWDQGTVPGVLDTVQITTATPYPATIPAGTTQTIVNVRLYNGSAGNVPTLIIPGGAGLVVTQKSTCCTIGYAKYGRIILNGGTLGLTAADGRVYVGRTDNVTSGGAIGRLDAYGGRLNANVTVGYATDIGCTGVMVICQGCVAYIGEAGVGSAHYKSPAPTNAAGSLIVSNSSTIVTAKSLTIGSANLIYQGCGRMEIYDGYVCISNNLVLAEDQATSTSSATAEGDLLIAGGALTVKGTLYNGGSGANDHHRSSIKIRGGDATVAVAGSYYHRTNATLVAEITGTDHTALCVNGIAYLQGGTLKVMGTPPAGDCSWDIVVGDYDNNSGTAGVSGTFSTFDATGLPNPGAWSIAYTADKVILSYRQLGTLVLVQ